MPVFEDEMLTIDDLARYLKLKPQTIYRWLRKGKVPGAKIGKEWRFRRSVIEQWIEESLKGDGAAAADSSSRGKTPIKKPQAKRKKSPEAN